VTNSRKHAPGAAVDVEVGYAATRLRLRIWDARIGRCLAGREGFGVGMREAVAMGCTLRTARSELGRLSSTGVCP